MKTTKRLTLSVFAALIAGMVISCGESNTTPVNGPLGKLPAIYKAASDKGYEIGKKLFEVSSREEAGKIMDEMEAVKKQMEADAAEAFEAVKGKEIPTEVSVEVPMKLASPLTITELDDAKYGKYKMEADVEMTSDVSYYKQDNTFPYQMVRMIVIDNKGNTSILIGRPGINLDKEAEGKSGVYPAGTKGHLTMTLRIDDWNAEALANMGKIRFVEFDTDVQKRATAINDSLKDIDKERQKEFFKNVKIEIK